MSLVSHVFRIIVYYLMVTMKWVRPSSLSFIPSIIAERKSSRLLSSFNVGDYVRIIDDESPRKGVIDQVRGSGWYTIQVIDSNKEAMQKKVRASQITLISKNIDNSMNSSSIESVLEKIDNEISSIKSPKTGNSSNSELDMIGKENKELPPLPVIDDLDALCANPIQNPTEASYLSQVQHHLSFSKWILFTDLHCSRTTLSTCIKVLNFVHQKAVEHNAGVLFLGDFWHFRGTLRVDVLNTVLDELAGWKQPLVMIPGNHDQVTLDGYNHALKPLQNSFLVGNSIPGPLILSRPTVFGKALFIPYLRNNLVMEGVLKSNYSEAAEAIFCHADVTGASMNDLIVSQGGVSPGLFPADIPIYSGHFHKPHTIRNAKGTSIEYIGSPYEVSLSEAQQDKNLLMLDASQGWKCIARYEVNLGRKHFRGESFSDLLNFESQTQAGDRIVLSIPSEDLHNVNRKSHLDKNGENSPNEVDNLDASVTKLREKGVTVEIREVKSITDHNVTPGNTEQVEDLSPGATLASYLSEQVNRGLMPNATSTSLLPRGMEIINEMEIMKEITEKSPKSKIEFNYVSLEGFGPFKKSVKYPLSSRGLVLLRGVNKDGGSDSNGTGKSSLAMAALWALTGRVDHHVVNDGKVSDVMTDGCTTTKVTIDGLLNDEPFRVVRTKTARKASLDFYLGERDMTTQSVTDTQEVINESLGIDFNVLSRSSFHGQHNINGLLEATDVKFKEELAYIVPLELWQRAAATARAKSRHFSRNETELKGMIKLREGDLKDIEIRRDHSLRKVEERRIIYTEKKVAAEKKPDIDSQTDDISIIQAKLEELEQKASDLYHELQQQKLSRVEEEVQIRSCKEEQSRVVTASRTALADAQRKFDQSLFRLQAADVSCNNLKKKWNVSFSSEKPRQLEFDTCPTCLQPLSANGVGHSHHDLREILDKEIDNVLLETHKANKNKEKAKLLCDEATLTLKNAEVQLRETSNSLEKISQKWDYKLSETELLIREVNKEQRNYSSKLAGAISSMNEGTNAEAIKVELRSEEELLNAAEEEYERSEADLLKAKENLAEMKLKAEQQRNSSIIHSQLSEVFGAKGIQTFVLQYTINALENISRAYLDELSDGSLRLSLTLDANDRVVRRASVRLPCGDYTERSLSSLSGGQWRRCQLALALGFSDLIGRRGRLQSSLMVMDEPFTHLDRSGRNHVGLLLRKLVKGDGCIGATGSAGTHATTIIIILQDLAAEELDETFDHVDEVIKEGGFSSVKVSESS